jgi:hypothetical protein
MLSCVVLVDDGKKDLKGGVDEALYVFLVSLRDLRSVASSDSEGDHVDRQYRNQGPSLANRRCKSGAAGDAA